MKEVNNRFIRVWGDCVCGAYRCGGCCGWLRNPLDSACGWGIHWPVWSEGGKQVIHGGGDPLSTARLIPTVIYPTVRFSSVQVPSRMVSRILLLSRSNIILKDHIERDKEK